jgi:ankyrin repeat protein
MKKKTVIVILGLASTLMISCYSVFAGKPDLCKAIKSQDIGLVQQALDAGADINCNCAAFPAIWFASYNSNCDIMRLLISKGAKVDQRAFEKTPLYYLVTERAALEPDTLLIQNKAYNARIIKNCKGDTALARQKNWLVHEDITRWSPVIDRIKLLLELGADPNIDIIGGVTTPFLKALELRDMEIVKAMLATGKVNLEIRYNAWLENVTSRTYSLTRFQYDKKDWQTIKNWEEIPGNDTPLMSAVSHEDLEMVKILVEAGAYVNAVKKVRGGDRTYDYWSGTITKTLEYYMVNVLDIAISTKNKAIQEYLISKGAVSLNSK